MRMKRLGAVGALVASGLVLGYLFGPPLVNAAGTAPATTSDVHIKDDTNSYKANVTSKHRLSVDTEADLTTLGDDFLDTFGLQYQLPNGQDMLASGTNGCLVTNSHSVVIASVNINISVPIANIVTVTLQDRSTIPNVLYKTSFDANEVGSHDFSFDGGIFSQNGFKIVATITGGSIDCNVVGQDLGAAGARPVLHASTPRR